MLCLLLIGTSLFRVGKVRCRRLRRPDFVRRSGLDTAQDAQSGLYLLQGGSPRHDDAVFLEFQTPLKKAALGQGKGTGHRKLSRTDLHAAGLVTVEPLI